MSEKTISALGPGKHTVSAHTGSEITLFMGLAEVERYADHVQGTLVFTGCLSAVVFYCCRKGSVFLHFRDIPLALHYLKGNVLPSGFLASKILGSTMKRICEVCEI